MTIRIAPRNEGIPDDAGDPQIPTSKSHGQRALCLARFLPGATPIENLPAARDVSVLERALAAEEDAVIDLIDNGTALRILSVLLPILGRSCRLDSGERLRRRPLTSSESFLAAYGCQCGDEWPRVFSGVGVEWPDELSVDASLTSQSATGVLLGAALRFALFAEQRSIRMRKPAAPDYVQVTFEVLEWFGFDVPRWWDGDDLVAEVRGWQPLPPGQSVTIPVDPSSCVFVAALLAMHGKREHRPRPVADDPHPDWLFVDDLDLMLETPADERLELTEIGRRPDTFPCLAALAALRCGVTVFPDVPSLRHKESDRITAMGDALNVLGVKCTELANGLVVEGPMPVHECPVAVPTPDDHRVVMAVALLGTRIPGGIEIQNPEAAEKSWPSYFDWLAKVAEVTWLDAG